MSDLNLFKKDQLGWNFKKESGELEQKNNLMIKTLRMF